MTVLGTALSAVKTRRPDEKHEREQEDGPPLAFQGVSAQPRPTELGRVDR
jgi:hypothetical protein